jgi:hypothetical protein
MRYTKEILLEDTPLFIHELSEQKMKRTNEKPIKTNQSRKIKEKISLWERLKNETKKA